MKIMLAQFETNGRAGLSNFRSKTLQFRLLLLILGLLSATSAVGQSCNVNDIR